MTVLAASNPSAGLVIGMGLGTVFVGLICIIAICYIMGAVIKALENRRPTAQAHAEKPQSESASDSAAEADKGELIAAISAVIAEELGESVEAIRIKSIRRIS